MKREPWERHAEAREDAEKTAVLSFAVRGDRPPFAFGKTGKFWETEKMFHGRGVRFVFHTKCYGQKRGFSKFYTVSTEFSTDFTEKTSRETFGLGVKVCGAVGFPFSENESRKSDFPVRGVFEVGRSHPLKRVCALLFFQKFTRFAGRRETSPPAGQVREPLAAGVRRKF